jgi:hypothetical protein
MKRAFLAWFTKYAIEVWDYDPETAAMIAHRSVQEKDAYYAIFAAGRRSMRYEAYREVGRAALLSRIHSAHES